ncbi:acyltransferase family protein [Chryseolinea lacunae]|uniref:Acyltransferase family protein n=1 Tax=Chryseolinea lacunae TaxID=2801331 RepID=A0ABS1KR52_9BACT|nr:acyltransferase family protein [Chryseolinea lacunae]MBL0740766.1 acyltransferase family protein [Chryseolinea lacunae]
MKTRETYIDNIRILLTVLVILHHTAITYGGPGGWYYSEPADGLVSGLLLTVFVSTNQAFFMGFFFLLSSYFIPASIARKGAARFMLDRLKRLGIPMVFYSLVITPVMIYMLVSMGQERPITWADVFIHREQWISLGVLWFAAALLLFTTVYVVAKRFAVNTTEATLALPVRFTIFLFALGLGVVSFLVRIVFPIGWTLEPVGFQFAHFPQYIALFVVGIVAYKNQWLAAITYEEGKVWRRVALLLVFVGFPCIYALKVVTHAELNAFLGGATIQSFVNAVWEQLLGVALVMAWLGIAKRRLNEQGAVAKECSRSAYAVYIIHPLVLLLMALLLKDVHLPSLVKFAITGTLSVAASFALGWVLVRVPLVKEVV